MNRRTDDLCYVAILVACAVALALRDWWIPIVEGW